MTTTPDALRQRRPQHTWLRFGAIVLGLAALLALSARVSAVLELHYGVAIQIGGRQTVMSELAGRLAFDGTALTLDELTLRSAEAQLRLDGTLDLLSEHTRADVRYAGSVDLERVAPWVAVSPAPRGVVSFSGRVEGPLADPGATFTLRGDRLALASGDVTGEAAVPFVANAAGRARVGLEEVGNTQRVLVGEELGDHESAGGVLFVGQQAAGIARLLGVHPLEDAAGLFVVKVAEDIRLLVAG